MAEEEWVKLATVDDTVVAELLVKLKQVKTPATPPPMQTPTPTTTSRPALSLEWSVRQPRSKSVVVQSKKQAPRASPTTPLSWSGATSVSGGGGSGSGGSFDGGPEEESGRASSLKLLDLSRSKVIGTSEATTSKKIRKKKTLAELKEEENLLEKERKQLKRELTTLRHNLEKERTRNENFKRIKVDMQLQAFGNLKIASELDNSDQLLSKLAYGHPVSALLPPTLSSNGGSLLDLPASAFTEANTEVLPAGKFVLPDLNIPIEENASYDALCGVS
ncbi:OLC1v1014619C1 [Oldenlandia corymbosa var. corymbosa]|uniref:OLC1v1014619C1 n=1 Tax=Oldenlandia corymbosa var. corymbosa TaxID=529605 RepID=A0AAV1E1W2_OLDCO|nr:OLC1v1014619C1 [Oldenlandia corymbosa var. corymbosa]